MLLPIANPIDERSINPINAFSPPTTKLTGIAKKRNFIISSVGIPFLPCALLMRIREYISDNLKLMMLWQILNEFLEKETQPNSPEYDESPVETV